MFRGHSQEGSWLSLGLSAKALGATSSDSGSGAEGQSFLWKGREGQEKGEGALLMGS